MGEKHTGGDIEGEPAVFRRVEVPGAVDIARQFAVVAGPVAGAAGGNDVAVAFVRRLRRVAQRGIDHGELDEAVEPAQRLVVGNMLLRLCRRQIGQLQVKGFKRIGHGRLSCYAPIVLLTSPVGRGRIEPRSAGRSG